MHVVDIEQDLRCVTGGLLLGALYWMLYTHTLPLLDSQVPSVSINGTESNSACTGAREVLSTCVAIAASSTYIAAYCILIPRSCAYVWAYTAYTEQLVTHMRTCVRTQDLDNTAQSLLTS